ncbi:MAG: hypothetical protein RL497_1208 [Pseudomonadota bacterium]|jgi:hypothetical protein
MTVYFYSKAKQMVLYLLLASLPIVGLVCFYFALNFWEAYQWAWVGFWSLLSAVFIGLFFWGLRWRIYIHTGIEVTDAGLVLHQGALKIQHDWEYIAAVKSWHWLQLLIIVDAKGNLILPVDHMLSGFAQFKLAIEQHVKSQNPN